MIFNQSFRTGIFPDERKLAKVSHLFMNKKGNKRNNPDHYRPISILPVVAKVSERIVYNQLYNYLTKNNLLTKNSQVFGQTTRSLRVMYVKDIQPMKFIPILAIG